MLAYESSPNCPDDFGVSSYICLMDSLIDRAEQVAEFPALHCSCDGAVTLIE